MEGFENFFGVDFWTALFTLCNMLITFALLKKFLFKPVKEMIDSRQKEIDDMYAAADDARRQAEGMADEYRLKLSQAQQTGEQIVMEAANRGKLREEEIIRQAEQESAAMMAKAETAIALERAKVLNDAKDEISSIAMMIAEKVVGRQMQDEDHSQLINAFIDNLGE